MNYIELQKKIDALEYWDCEALDFSINYFGDEIKMVIADNRYPKKQEDEKEMCIIIKFLLCYRVKYETDAKGNAWRDSLHVRDMNRRQLGHYVQDITIKESKDNDLLEVSLNTSLLFATIICKNISIEHKVCAHEEFFWSKNEFNHHGIT